MKRLAVDAIEAIAFMRKIPFGIMKSPDVLLLLLLIHQLLALGVAPSRAYVPSQVHALHIPMCSSGCLFQIVRWSMLAIA